ncbi:SH2 domain-containing protein 3C-like isoform X2 [Mytilus trossulus]|uniref:SH2 domain-containing protein 3C-like isoform X2 n=1 Tax=Mytilus trossulus TaxID=6551 RepID=UPI003005D138
MDNFIFDWGGGYGIVLERQQVMAHKHIAIPTWLEALGLSEYNGLFHQYNGVEDLIYLGESDIKDLGLKNGAHRAKIVSSLRLLKDRYERGHKATPVIQRSNSASAQLSASPPTPTVYSPDYQVVNVAPGRLEHDLIAELQSEPSELKHWPWYHGSISRQRAEQLTHRTGDFLVRDSSSHPGDFVLTCSTKGVPLHFMINSEVKEQETHIPLISYRFEDELFGSIQDLIQFYMAHRKKITKSSGAVISNPIARTMPLSYYDTKYGFMSSLNTTGHYTPSGGTTPKPSPFNTPSGTPNTSPHSQRRHPTRSGSHPLLPVDSETFVHRVPHIDRSDSLPVIHGRTTPPRNNQTIPHVVIPHYHQRAGSEPVLGPSPGYSVIQNNGQSDKFLTPHPNKLSNSNSDSDLNKPPPPKPSRIPSIKYKQKPLVVKRTEVQVEDDRDYTDYMQVKQAPSWLKNPAFERNNNHTQDTNDNFIKNSSEDYDNNFENEKQHPKENGLTEHYKCVDSKSRKCSDTRFNFLDQRDYSEIPDIPVTLNESDDTIASQNDNRNSYADYDAPKTMDRQISIPEIDIQSNFHPKLFSSSLLTDENKPLEPAVLIDVKNVLLTGDPKTLANHSTKLDLDLCKVVEEHDLGVGVISGLELLTLPQGSQLRQDIIERCYCSKIFTMVMILTCPKIVERASMLSQWIQTAVHLRSSLGNLLGFANVMEGLMSPQIQRLKDTWLVLRQNHTNSAFVFDTKLKTAFKTLNDGSGLLPLQNVCIPDIAPLVVLLERDMDTASMQLPWESSDPNSGLDILLTHLDTARLVTAQCGTYRINGQSIIKNFTEDVKTCDIFRTEFHMRMCWGAKGVVVGREDRQSKFEQLLTVLSNRTESSDDDGTAV